ncbi:unnamed protein product [Paramecium primaurelia]|uniref:Uncharacterized protein n=1 Tax=Paramecium primaurelia TaxID=5886 RepID=A0A8S1N725_PARPR|nr:unnamed protein product [Paramecium primaurelia]
MFLYTLDCEAITIKSACNIRLLMNKGIKLYENANGMVHRVLIKLLQEQQKYKMIKMLKNQVGSYKINQKFLNLKSQSQRCFQNINKQSCIEKFCATSNYSKTINILSEITFNFG